MKMFFRIASIVAFVISFAVLRSYEVPFWVAYTCLTSVALVEFLHGEFHVIKIKTNPDA